LSLGIDRPARRLTVSRRGEDGDVLLARQVSTEPDRIHAFFKQLTRDRLRDGGSFVAVLEVCGFNDRLIRVLKDYRCEKVILIQPDERKKRKTDRQDAAAPSELLWANRDRLLSGKPVRGLRQVEITGTADQEDRRLTALRKESGVARARLTTKVKRILRRHNRQWGLPTKTFPTAAAVTWLEGLALPGIERLEMDHLLADLGQAARRLKDLEQVIARRSADSSEVAVLSSMPGVGRGFTALSLACRAGRVGRLPRARSLANSWGLTPGCRNGGGGGQRLGRITKAGRATARWLLARPVHKVLRRDARLREWFRRVKRRRGPTVARVAVMRKLATVIWHMPGRRKAYAGCREPAAAGGR
jgi:hypothetical protein